MTHFIVSCDLQVVNIMLGGVMDEREEGGDDGEEEEE